MSSLEVLLAKAAEKRDISDRLLIECRRIKKLRDSYPEGSRERMEQRLILEGLLIATNIVVNK